MRDDLSMLMQRIQGLPDRELVSILEQDENQYTSEAISIAEEEAEARGGLQKLKQHATQPGFEKQPQQRLQKAKQFIEDLFSKLIGRAPSEQYPALSYVSTALRLISFVPAALAVFSSFSGLYELATGSMEGWLPPVLGALQAGVVFLILFGSSKIINVVIDIEKNTREGHRSTQEEEPYPTGEST